MKKGLQLSLNSHARNSISKSIVNMTTEVPTHLKGNGLGKAGVSASGKDGEIGETLSDYL